jgi:hypothetical protein
VKRAFGRRGLRIYTRHDDIGDKNSLKEELKGTS